MRKHDDGSTSFLDLSTMMNMMLVVMMVLALLQMNPPVKKDANIVLKAEFLVEMEWEDNSESDVDLFVKTPTGVVYYGNQNIPGASLDRDDLGSKNDTIFMDDGSKVVIPGNWERTAIRAKTKGSYGVNVLLFNKSKKEASAVPVTIKVTQLNPYRMIYSGTVILLRTKHEVTAVTFDINKHGGVVNTSTKQKSIINSMKKARR